MQRRGLDDDVISVVCVACVVAYLSTLKHDIVLCDMKICSSIRGGSRVSSPYSVVAFCVVGGGAVRYGTVHRPLRVWRS